MNALCDIKFAFISFSSFSDNTIKFRIPLLILINILSVKLFPPIYTSQYIDQSCSEWNEIKKSDHLTWLLYIFYILLGII